MDEQVTPAERRIAGVIAAAIGGLSARDRAERIAYCRRHNWHGVDYGVNDYGEIELFWPGGPESRLLAVLPKNALSEEGLRHPLGMTPLDVPDSPAGLDDE